MGYLLIVGKIDKESGRTDDRPIERDTLACGHCGGVVAYMVNGDNRALEFVPTQRCRHCRKDLCKACRQRYAMDKEQCSPLLAKIERAVKGLGWDERLLHVPTFIPTH